MSRASLVALLAPALLAGCGSSSSRPETDAATPADGGGPDDDASPPGDGGADASRPDAGPLGCAPGPTGEPDVVGTATGAVRGVRDPAGDVVAFLGIPYAEPPLGEARLREPAPHACWEGVLEATAFGPECPQLDADGNLAGDEDCLQLNVWAPLPLEGAARAVMVWLHGGGNNQGSTRVTAADGSFLYDAAELARRTGNVVVSLNYRLGPLGFLAHPALAGAGGSAGNYGLLDQQAGLRWIRDNVAAFGGDPDRVLLFGESAGGLDTCLQVVSPLASGLFSRALVESGGCAASTRAQAETRASQLAEALGCAGEADDAAVAACLRAAPVEPLLRAIDVGSLGLATPPFGPSVDGRVLPRAPLEILAAGEHQHVPFVLGTNRDETSTFVPTTITTEAQAETFMRGFLAQFALSPAQADGVLAVYPFADYPSPRAAAVALSTDVRWTCAARLVLQPIRSGQDEPVFRYWFTQTLRAPRAAALGAFHGLEIPYVFGHLTVGGYVPTAGDVALSAAMSAYWGRFADTGDPNGGTEPAWPRYALATDDYLHLGEPVEARQGVRTAQCDALAAALR